MKVFKENNVVSNSNSLGTCKSYARVVLWPFAKQHGMKTFARVQLISPRGDLFLKCQKTPSNDNIENSCEFLSWDEKELFIKWRERCNWKILQPRSKWSLAFHLRICHKEITRQLITLIFHCVWKVFNFNYKKTNDYYF